MSKIMELVQIYISLYIYLFLVILLSFNDEIKSATNFLDFLQYESKRISPFSKILFFNYDFHAFKISIKDIDDIHCRFKKHSFSQFF